MFYKGFPCKFYKGIPYKKFYKGFPYKMNRQKNEREFFFKRKKERKKERKRKEKKRKEKKRKEKKERK